MRYLYRLTYTKREQLFPNFGKGFEDKPLPYVVHRDYDFESDDYVIGLSSDGAQATKIEKRVVYDDGEDKDWKQIYPEKQKETPMQHELKDPIHDSIMSTFVSPTEMRDTSKDKKEVSDGDTAKP